MLYLYWTFPEDFLDLCCRIFLAPDGPGALYKFCLLAHNPDRNLITRFIVIIEIYTITIALL